MGAYDNYRIVIGGLGFVGSHLVERLVNNKYDIVLFDNKSSGAYENIKDFYSGDVLDPKKLSWYPRIPVVFNLGIPSSYRMFNANKHLYADTIRDFVDVLEYCKHWDSKLIYTSTASLYYGNSIPFKENMNIYQKDLYSECYYNMERLASLYYSLYGVKSIGLRLFNVYGKRESCKRDNASIICQMITSVGEGNLPVIYGDGTQTRDFVYIDDVIDALMSAMNKDNINCDIYNIGSGTTYSFNEIIEILEEILDIKVESVYKKSPIDNYVEHSLADITKAKKFLNYKPKVSIEKGAKAVVEEYLYKGLFK